MIKKIQDPEVAHVFKTYPNKFRKELLILRQLIFDTAKEVKEVDELIESLKWGQPSYVPKKKNIGTAVRIHFLKSKPDQYGMYFNCNTNMILRIKRKYKSKFSYKRNRAIIFKKGDKLLVKELKDSIKMALTYHLKKK